MIVILDHGDPFAGSLVQYLGTLGATLAVHRGPEIAAVTRAAPPFRGLVLAAGADAPRVVRATLEAVGERAAGVPVLAIGPAHLALALAVGARLAPAPRLLHGRTSPVLHRGRGLFAGLENPFPATRYDALVVEPGSVPAVLEIAAWTPEGEVMGLRHRDREWWGVQFHPQSILTQPGLRLMENFLTLCRQHKEVPR